MSIMVRLLPYEILAGKATSYADISLTILNTSQKDLEVEISRIEILSAKSKQILMSSTSQNLKLPHTISLKPSEKQVLEYRLQSESQIYQRHQDVISQVYYRQNHEFDQVIQSNDEAVAFMIP